MVRAFLLFYVFLFLGFAFSSCCLNCEETPPQLGTLNVQLSDDVSDSILLYVYKGKSVDGGELQETDTLEDDTSYTLPSNNTYSGKAIYKKGDEKVIAIDRDEIEVKDKSDRDCADSVCYIPDDGTLDLVLKENPL